MVETRRRIKLRRARTGPPVGGAAPANLKFTPTPTPGPQVMAARSVRLVAAGLLDQAVAFSQDVDGPLVSGAHPELGALHAELLGGVTPAQLGDAALVVLAACARFCLTAAGLVGAQPDGPAVQGRPELAALSRLVRHLELEAGVRGLTLGAHRWADLQALLG